jgi:hypothetical protein
MWSDLIGFYSVSATIFSRTYAQPLDVVAFKPLAQNYSNEVTQHLHASQSLRGIKKGNFFRLF